MGKKPEPPASDVSAKKVISSKAPEAAAPPVEIRRVESTRGDINGAQVGTAPPEETVRVSAYYRWDAAGRPGGDGVRFWLEAEQELIAGGDSIPEKSLQKQ